MKTREKVISLLRDSGISPLESRVAVYSWIDSNRVHPTVDIIYRALSPSYPTLSRTTVYNALKTLVQAGLVNQLNIDDGELRYDVDVSVHAHAKCRNCGKIIDLFGISVPSLNDDFQLWNMDCCQINFYGVCPECAREYSGN